eukprot:1217285-Alexandrium_andersonii.AAC.1
MSASLVGSEMCIRDRVDPLDMEIKPGELREVMRRIKAGRQGGPDGMKPEFVKWAGEEAVEQVAAFFTRCTRNRCFPESWAQAD